MELWPPEGQDLNKCNFFLWEYLKDRVYLPDPLTLDDLKDNITSEICRICRTMLKRVTENCLKWPQACISGHGVSSNIYYILVNYIFYFWYFRFFTNFFPWKWDLAGVLIGSPCVSYQSERAWNFLQNGIFQFSFRINTYQYNHPRNIPKLLIPKGLYMYLYNVTFETTPL